jgi:hypothetical protein
MRHTLKGRVLRWRISILSSGYVVLVAKIKKGDR